MEWFKDLFNKKTRRSYLDYAAATPLLKEVRTEMEKYLGDNFYNPNAIYAEGERVRKDVEEYRAQIAKLLGVNKESVIFTSGGTEANVWAVRGVRPGKIVTEEGVHPSVEEAARGITGAKTSLISSITTENTLGRKIREERKKNHSEYPLLHIDAFP
ncbi:aminotransferase class V-fold PLP-dependent enzyme, partial [Candidatus Parcubacteria bacterium]|nr:aminotransferase class V-fold PLP-dependent enzyme [Candidatus Parcubacteria bacterium]